MTHKKPIHEKYDYLVVGAGLTGAVFADAARKAGKTCLVIDKRDHIAGNIYTERIDGIDVHRYGAHIFHTSDKDVWDYVNAFAEFNNYVNCPIARYEDELYNLPFNMNTFSKMWSVSTPGEAAAIIDAQKSDVIRELNGHEPENLEEQALSLVGRDIYEKLIKGYTEKQWGRDCTELPPSIIKRLPVRYVYDNNYFNDRYQGIPIDGYTRMIEKMFDETEVILKCEYRSFIEEYPEIARRTIYTGPIDEFFDFRLGPLEYRSLHFETEEVHENNYQGNAVVNYTKRDVPYTRIIEHKHFQMSDQLDNPITYITHEYPADWRTGDEPYYPINDEKNTQLYEEYRRLADSEGDVVFAGRLGGYKYYDMDKAIIAAFDLVLEELGIDLRAE